MRRIANYFFNRPARAFSTSTKNQKIDEVIRVDQAGEVAAVRICRNQLFWISPLDPSVPVIKEILQDELIHEKTMNDFAKKHNVKLTSLDPLFNIGAFAMGTITAVLGKEAMMCCHAAVEITIAQHYNDQLRELEELETSEKLSNENEEKDWKEVKDIVVKFRNEEEHHQHLGEVNGADQAPLYPLLYNGIRLACKVGVALAKRI